jgi:predicted DNA-binding ribbon-helix-helix protein
VSSLVRDIAAKRKQGNLSSAIRVFVVEHLQNREKSAGLPHSNGSTINETRSPQTWRRFARRG